MSTQTEIKRKPCPSCGEGTVLDEKSFGDWVKKRYREKGLSLKDLGEAVGKSAQYVCEISLGRRPLFHSEIRKTVQKLQKVLS